MIGLEIDSDNWSAEVLESTMPVVVEFWHQQCPYCRKFNPIYDALSKEYSGKLKFMKVNVLESEENRALAIKYGVMGTPTLKFFYNGRTMDEIVGFRSKDQLREDIDTFLRNYKTCLEQSSPI